MKGLRSIVAIVFAACALAAQQPEHGDEGRLPPVPAGLEGRVHFRCSDLLLRCSEMMAKDFASLAPDVDVGVSGGGSGASIQALLEGKVDIAATARPIRKPEVAKFADRKVEFVEVPVAVEAIALVAPRDCDWLDYITIEELRRIWIPSDDVETWKDVRSSWPDVKLQRYVRRPTTGFTSTLRPVFGDDARRLAANKEVRGKALFDAIAATAGSIGMTDSVNAAANAKRVKLVPINGGAGPVAPTKVSIGNGHYTPLTRPLLLYVNRDALARPEVREFVRFYLANGRRVSSSMRMVPAAGTLRRCAERVIAGRESGTRFLDKNGQPRKGSLADLFRPPPKKRGK